MQGSSMQAILLSLAALFGGISILLVGNGLLGTLLGIRSVSLGFSPEVTGVVMAAYFAGFIAGSLLCVHVIKRAGHIRTFAALAAISSAASLTHVLFNSPIAWAILRMIIGFCFAGLYMIIESWLNNDADNSNRGRVLSIYMMVNLASLAAGQLFLLLPDPDGFLLFCVASILISLGLVPIALTTSSAPPPHPTHPVTLTLLYQTSPLGLAGCFASGLALGTFWSMAPVFCRTLGLAAASTAIFMVATILGGLLLLWPIGRLSDRLDRRHVITFLCAASAMSSLAIVVIGGSAPIVLFACAAIWGSVTFPIYSLSVAHTNDFLKADDFLAVSSSLLLVYGSGAILGPLIAGLTMGYLGPVGLYVALSGVMAAMVLFALHRMTMRQSPTVEGRAPVVFIPRTTHVVQELDPRIEPS
ncbi:MAG: MFS family permease [Alphaproteobacteria bacterium]|jgi:MFS family permease